MKKYLLTGFVGMFLLLASCIDANGQLVAAHMRHSPENSISKIVVIAVDRNMVNPKAVRDFMRSYKTVSNEEWYELPDALVAMFSLDSINYRVDYNRRGIWLHTMRTYDENTLPKDIRHLVKSSYYDFAIRLVHEIETPRYAFTYIIKLEGKRELINLRVINGEMEEWQKFKKI
jgi:hypothetical protein